MTWTETMKYGSVPEVLFEDTVTVDVTHNLIIVPVNIKGEIYRFLYDTGAPFAISKEIQDKYEFSIVSSGKIVDSDDNRTEVNYVSVDTLLLGQTPFTQQTAFVADFNANPILKCMDLDGIIGSNLMHHCNWTIDMQNKQLSFSNSPMDTSGITVPFRTNLQYDVLVDLKLNDLILPSIKLDYGSNGALSLSNELFDLLLEREDIDTFIVQKGLSQSGIIGTAVESNEKLSPIEAISLGELTFENIVAMSGSMELLGTKLLSNYLVSIDWDTHQLHFKANTKDSLMFRSFGASLAYSEEKGVYVQSIIEDSKASKMSIIPNLKVLKVNDLDFTTNDFCEYMLLLDTRPDTLYLELEVEGMPTPFTLIKEELFKYN